MGEVDAYLAGQPEDVARVLRHIADLVLEVVPDAEQGTSYGAPAFRYGGRPLLGFKVGRDLSLFPFSADAVAAVADRCTGLRVTKGTIAFTVDHPAPDDVVEDLVRLRLAELG